MGWVQLCRTHCKDSLFRLGNRSYNYRYIDLSRFRPLTRNKPESCKVLPGSIRYAILAYCKNSIFQSCLLDCTSSPVP